MFDYISILSYLQNLQISLIPYKYEALNYETIFETSEWKKLTKSENIFSWRQHGNKMSFMGFTQAQRETFRRGTCTSVHTILNIVRIIYARARFHCFIYNKQWNFYLRHYMSCYISNTVRTHWYGRCFRDFDNSPTELLPCATTLSLSKNYYSAIWAALVQQLQHYDLKSNVR